MGDTIIGVLAVVGIVSLAFMVFCIGAIIYYHVVDWIDRLKWNYKYKHRFDKPPLAKCYCKDCIYYGNDGSCRGTYPAHVDDWFCKDATPLKKDPEKQKITRCKNKNRGQND